MTTLDDVRAALKPICPVDFAWTGSRDSVRSTVAAARLAAAELNDDDDSPRNGAILSILDALRDANEALDLYAPERREAPNDDPVILAGMLDALLLLTA